MLCSVGVACICVSVGVAGLCVSVRVGVADMCVSVGVVVGVGVCVSFGRSVVEAVRFRVSVGVRVSMVEGGCTCVDVAVCLDLDVGCVSVEVCVGVSLGVYMGCVSVGGCVRVSLPMDKMYVCVLLCVVDIGVCVSARTGIGYDSCLRVVGVMVVE